MARDSTELKPVFDYPSISSGQIRVLQLRAGEDSDALSGELITANLYNDDITGYDALSHM